MSIPILIAFPLLGFLVMLQSAVVSRINLMQGNADIILLVILAWALQKRVDCAWYWAVISGLMINLVSALPLFIPLISYLLANGFALLIKKRIGQIPYLAMLIATFVGTLISLGMSWISLILTANPIPFIQAMNIIILPSLILNILLSFLVYFLVTGLAEQLYPQNLTT